MTDEHTTGRELYSISRRDVLKAAGFTGGALLLGSSQGVGLVAASMHNESYYLVQNGTTTKVTPVTYKDGDGNYGSIQDFYNYAASPNLGGSNTPLEIEDNNQSRMFLYRDDDGLYVVFLHDDNNSINGGGEKNWQARFVFDGLPSDGSWVVDEGNDSSDDFGDNYAFYWRWYPQWSDGGHSATSRVNQVRNSASR